MSLLLKLCTSSVSRATPAVPWAFAQTRQLWQGLDQRKAAGQQEETRLAWQQQAQDPSAGRAEAGTSSPAAETQPSPLLNDIARVLEGPLSLKLGKNCMVGEGLATVDLGLVVEGRMVAVQVEPLPAPGSSDSSSSSPVPSARAYAESRTRQRVLQSFGWATATVLEQDWVAAGQDDHKKMHLLVTAVKTALGQDGEGGHGHQHHSGCGCH